MSFAVLHMQKLKQPAIKGMQIHNQREKESQTNPDINVERSHLNYDLVNRSNVDYNELINKKIEEEVTTGKAIRKDAVKLASFLVTSDKEYFDGLSEKEEKRFFESAYEFFCDEYGEKNIAYAMVHKDEKTPHMHVGFVPITEDGRLSAKDFFGKKQQLVKLQDGFHEHMKENGFDLNRGVSSDKKHIEMAKYKAETFEKRANEAQQKYEKVMGQIQKIDEHTKSIDSIEAKKVLGLVGMKESDYQTLVSYATNSADLQNQVVNLQEKLTKAEEQVAQLKSEIQTGQDKVRDYYKDLQVTNEDLNENLNFLASEKAKEMVEKSDLVSQYQRLFEKYKEAKEKFNKAYELLYTYKEKSEKLESENKELKTVNQKLQERVQVLTQQFSALKERVSQALHFQLDRIKSFLNIKNVDQETIKDLENSRQRFVEQSLNQIEKPQKEKQMEKEIQIER